MKYQAALFWGGGKWTVAQRILVATLISSVNIHFFSNCRGFQQATNDHFTGKKQISSNHKNGSMTGLQMRKSHGNKQAEEKSTMDLLRLAQPERDYLYPDSASNHQALGSKPARAHSTSHPH